MWQFTPVWFSQESFANYIINFFSVFYYSIILHVDIGESITTIISDGMIVIIFYLSVECF